MKVIKRIIIPIIILLFQIVGFISIKALDISDEEIIISNICIDDDFSSDTIIIVFKTRCITRVY